MAKARKDQSSTHTNRQDFSAIDADVCRDCGKEASFFAQAKFLCSDCYWIMQAERLASLEKE